MKIIYQADDGTFFDNEWDCEDYENKLNHPYLKNIAFFNKENHVYFINFDIENPFSDDIYYDCWKVIIHNIDEFNDFIWLANNCGWCEFEEITEPGIWERYEERDDDDLMYDVHWRK